MKENAANIVVQIWGKTTTFSGKNNYTLFFAFKFYWCIGVQGHKYILGKWLL